MDKIVVSGSSSGGIAAMQWVPYVKSLTSYPDRVYSVIDSGIIYNALA